MAVIMAIALSTTKLTCSALLVILVVPWWAECYTSSTSDCREVGIAILSPTNTTGPMVESSDFTLKKSLVQSGHMFLLSGIPVLISSTRVEVMLSLADSYIQQSVPGDHLPVSQAAHGDGGVLSDHAGGGK